MNTNTYNQIYSALAFVPPGDHQKPSFESSAPIGREWFARSREWSL